MLIFKKTADLSAFIAQIRASGKTLGFVPTMGALHQGHLSLIARSKQTCDVTICSIFVNPTQFNDPKDLERYPRTPEKDSQLLETSNCDALFLPSVQEMYPSGPQKEQFDFGYLDKILEGAFRPGHFNGVAQVVKRFFELVTPDKAFFGSKDYQQVMIVKAMVAQTQLPVEIVPCPILREADGLAMSSRNVLLNTEEREIAALVPQIMLQAKDVVLTKGIDAAKLFVAEQTLKQPLMKLDYYEVCDADTLTIFSELQEGKKAIALIAVFVGKVRLIDNLPVNF